MSIEVYFYPSLTEELFRLRESVFIGEQHFPYEIDDNDSRSIHVGLFKDNELVGVARYFPIDEAKNTYIVGRFAIKKDLRGLGLGKLLMEKIEHQLMNKGAKEILIHAQIEAVDFYVKCGFKIEGDTFIEEGHEHKLVKKTLEHDN